MPSSQAWAHPTDQMASNSAASARLQRNERSVVGKCSQSGDALHPMKKLGAASLPNWHVYAVSTRVSWIGPRPPVNS